MPPFPAYFLLCPIRLFPSPPIFHLPSVSVVSVSSCRDPLATMLWRSPLMTSFVFPSPLFTFVFSHTRRYPWSRPCFFFFRPFSFDPRLLLGCWCTRFILRIPVEIELFYLCLFFFPSLFFFDVTTRNVYVCPHVYHSPSLLLFFLFFLSRLLRLIPHSSFQALYMRCIYPDSGSPDSPTTEVHVQ